MSSYFYYKSAFKQYETDPHLYKFLCGGFVDDTAISVTYPTDLVKRRMQLQSFDNPNIPRYSGIIDLF